MFTALASRSYVRNASAMSFVAQTAHRFEITGKIDALSTGVTIVDLPGYGDSNNIRFGIYDPYSWPMVTFIFAEIISRRNTFRRLIALF